MRLEMRSACSAGLVVQQPAWICVQECMSCAGYAESAPHACLDGGGESVKRPRPPASDA